MRPFFGRGSKVAITWGAKRCHSVQLSKSADCGEAHLLVALLLHFDLTSQHSFFRAVYYATSFESQCRR
jgi:hypothetical protein